MMFDLSCLGNNNPTTIANWQPNMSWAVERKTSGLRSTKAVLKWNCGKIAFCLNKLSFLQHLNCILVGGHFIEQNNNSHFRTQDQKSNVDVPPHLVWVLVQYSTALTCNCNVLNDRVYRIDRWTGNLLFIQCLPQRLVFSVCLDSKHRIDLNL